jgi:O-antigen/teichoic acid export membrane protein
VVATPILLRELGTDRLGVLSLALVLIGYLSLLDLGLGRALTQLVAAHLGTDKEGEAPLFLWTYLSVTVAVALIGAAGLFLASGTIASRVLSLPDSLREETTQALWVLALSMPIVIATAGLRGFLEAHQRFGLLLLVRAPLGVFTYLGPLLVIPFTHSLVAVVGVLLVGRIVGLVVHLYFCIRVSPAIRRVTRPRRDLLLRMIGFAAGTSVTNVISPFLAYLDRFLIGAVVSAAAVAYYAVPYDVVTRFSIAPVALTGVLFPAFATSFRRDIDRVNQLFMSGSKYVLLLMLPITLAVVSVGPDALTFWLGADFADRSALILQWLAVGVFVNSVAQIPFAFIQGAGRPDLTARLHVAELIIYAPVLWWLVSNWGIEGAAIAWVARVCVDTIALLMLSQHLLPATRRLVLQVGFPTVAGCAVLAIGLLLTASPIQVRILYLVACSLTVGIAGWALYLSSSERAFLSRARHV